MQMVRKQKRQMNKSDNQAERYKSHGIMTKKASRLEKRIKKDQKIVQYSQEASKQERMKNNCIEQIVARKLLHQIELLILTTDQAYLHKIGFTRTIHFLQYYTSQQSIKLMKKILYSQSNRKLRPMSTLPFLFHGLDNQSWTYQPRKLEFVISLSQFSLIPLSIYCRSNQLQFKGRFLFPNGRPLSIPAEYKDQFLSRANKNANKIRFFTQQDRNQLFLQSNIFFDSNCSAEQKIYECLQYIENSEIDFENALQMLNLSRKHNLFSYKMTRKQLQVKNKLSKLLFENKSTEQLGTIHDFKEQNSSVSSVFSITDTKSSSIQQKIVKNGGFFQVSKKTSLITDQNGVTEQKDLAQKTPIPTLKSYKGLIQQKMKRQIKLVKEILYDKYLLKYYTTENEPTTIYMDFASGTLKDAIYCNRLSFNQLLNLSEQLIEAMSILHKSKIVHRDLKPENILISGSSLKIIDFCESAKTDDVFQQNHFLGSTLPYSAIQCILGRAEGFNKKQIDLWSVAMILYEITFKSIPMYYQRFVGNEIVQKWRQGTQFSISPLYRRQKGLRLIEQVISLVCIRGLKIKPQERLSLKTYSQLLSSINSFQEMMREDL